MTLDDQAAEFAAELNGFSVPALGEAARFGVARVGSLPERWVGPGTFTAGKKGYGPIPLVGSRGQPGDARLGIRCSFVVRLDDSGALTVRESWLTVEAQTAQWRPIIRIEVDPSEPREAQTHLHIDGRSSLLAWARGAAGRPYVEDQKLHFPLGGRHFRPALEDLLFFVDGEKLFSDWHDPGWRALARNSLGRFRLKQTEATIRRHLSELRAEGWTVNPPDQ